MPNRNWNIGHIESIIAKARMERAVLKMRSALNRVDANLSTAITRGDLERLIHRAVLEYRMSPHVSPRAARDMAHAEASRLVEQHGPHGDDA